jgi:hypothetical protein
MDSMFRSAKCFPLQSTIGSSAFARILCVVSHVEWICLCQKLVMAFLVKALRRAFSSKSDSPQPGFVDESVKSKNLSVRILVLGSTGCGKTSVLLFLLVFLEPEVSVSHCMVSCFLFRS